MAALAAYSKTVIGIFILTAFAELLLPGEKWRKYGRLVLGLMLLSAFLSPLQRLLGHSPEIPAFTPSPAEEAAEPDEAAQETMVLAVYEAQLAEALGAELGVEAGGVRVSAREDGSLARVDVQAGPSLKTAAVEQALHRLGLKAETVCVTGE